MSRGRVLILWNQLDDDVVELWRRDGRRAPDWDPNLLVEPWDTVAEEIEQIVQCVKDGGYDAKSINIRDNFETLLETLRDERPDVVLNLVEWFHDDLEHETHVPAIYELLAQSYTGNRPLALSLCQKKPQAKALLAAAGLPVPRGIVVDLATGRAPDKLDLRYPLIVKPAFDDASGGIDAGSVVRDRASLDARVQMVVGDHKMPALVEEFIEGREIHCAILGNSPPSPLPLYEMQFKKGAIDNEGRALPNIITYRAKWDPYSRDYYGMESKCPAPNLSDELAARMQAIAVRAYQALGCRDYARVDMRLAADTNEPYILEVNPNPDLADGCAFAQCVRASGRTYAQAIQEIVGYALERSKTKIKAEPFPSEQLVIEYKAQRGGRTTR
ncbi:MAG TPA: ATP-grasp domain-containing protein [Kofleriaceae bacterium]|nr:ATP-grasp domain-containing protein [Kofleriaceae bacterium]